ncbi:MAG: substrate-binding domain-containing protein [Kiritimatiellae bacterium]|nr:substrate-binding domain-containing protein [Kiritimatiellia bacterium]
MRTKSVLLQLGYTSKMRLDGIAAYAKEHGWLIAVEDRSSLPRGWTGDGALVMLRARQPRMAAFAQGLASRGIPVVDLSICHPELALPRVVGDHRAIGALAAEHFAERHFRNAAFFAKDWTEVEKLRLAGFAESWRGGDPGRKPLKWVWRRECDEQCYDDWKALGAWLSERLKAAPKPLALFAFNDNDAARALDVALDAGLAVPEEVAILGCDDEPLICENQRVTISSVRHDLKRIGWECAALLDRLMEGAEAPSGPTLVPPLGISVRRSTDTVAASSPAMRKALSLIARHLGDAYGAADLAREMGISRATLGRLFAAELDSAPAKEIARQRLARAKLLLARTDRPLKAIARECGFCDAAHFTNAFRRATGLTPRAARRR